MKFNYESMDFDKPIYIKTLNGIGDFCWLAVKISYIKKIYNIPKITLRMQLAGDYRDSRAIDFIRKFDFIDEIFETRFSIFKNKVCLNKRLNYIDLGYNKDKSEYTLIINPYIEHEGRIEQILPDVPCNFNFFNNSYQIDKQDIVFAKEFAKKGSLFGKGTIGHIVFHLGCKTNNTFNGMNKDASWKIIDWVKLAKKIRKITNLPIYVLGASYDNDYAEEFLQSCNDGNIFNLCGKTKITQSIEMLRQSCLVVSFASGIGIASTYLETPTLMFWMPETHSVSPYEFIHFSNSFSTNWVPPYCIGKSYMPAFYHIDDVNNVFNKCETLLKNNVWKNW